MKSRKILCVALVCAVMMSCVTRIENKDFTRELNVRVPDVSWQLEG